MKKVFLLPIMLSVFAIVLFFKYAHANLPNDRQIVTDNCYDKAGHLTGYGNHCVDVVDHNCNAHLCPPPTE